MIPRRGGKIVNIASIAGLTGNSPNWGLSTVGYNTSKGALFSMTRALAAEWGRYNINVNAICPGFFPSKMSNESLGRIETVVCERTPLGRLGGEEDLKGAAVFLASEASRHVTGQALVVDGGYVAVEARSSESSPVVMTLSIILRRRTSSAEARTQAGWRCHERDLARMSGRGHRRGGSQNIAARDEESGRPSDAAPRNRRDLLRGARACCAEVRRVNGRSVLRWPIG